MVRLAEWRELWRLARARTRSAEDYRAFQACQGGLILQHLTARGVVPPGRALDLGCGLGGYTLALREAGFAVVSLDLDTVALDGLSGQVRPVRADATALPFRGTSFHLVFCASLIEHVAAPERLLAEVARVLRPRGYCYLSFPPFYSPLGGHQFAPFHFLGERAAVSLYGGTRGRRDLGWRAQLVSQGAGYATAYRSYGLHRMTIRRGCALARTSGLELVDLSARFLPVNTARWGVLGEFLTWHVQFLLRRPA